MTIYADINEGSKRFVYGDSADRTADATYQVPGLVFQETDTGKAYKWDGDSWEFLGIGGSESVSTSQDRVITLLNGVTAAGAGDSVRPAAAKKTIQILGTFSATVELEVSLNGTDWETLVSTTTPGIWENEFPWTFIRGNVTAYTSGSITLIVGI